MDGIASLAGRDQVVSSTADSRERWVTSSLMSHSSQARLDIFNHVYIRNLSGPRRSQDELLFQSENVLGLADSAVMEAGLSVMVACWQA